MRPGVVTSAELVRPGREAEQSAMIHVSTPPLPPRTWETGFLPQKPTIQFTIPPSTLYKSTSDPYVVPQGILGKLNIQFHGY